MVSLHDISGLKYFDYHSWVLFQEQHTAIGSPLHHDILIWKGNTLSTVVPQACLQKSEGMIAVLQALSMCPIFCDPSLTLGLLKDYMFSYIIWFKIFTGYIYSSCMHMWSYW